MKRLVVQSLGRLPRLAESQPDADVGRYVFGNGSAAPSKAVSPRDEADE